jgi:hypothetical protein
MTVWSGEKLVYTMVMGEVYGFPGCPKPKQK